MAVIPSVTQPQFDVMSTSAGSVSGTSDLIPGTPRKHLSVLLEKMPVKMTQDGEEDGGSSGGADVRSEDVGTRSRGLPRALQERLNIAFSRSIREGRSVTSEHVRAVLMKKEQDLRRIAGNPEEVKRVVDYLRYTAKKCLPQAGELPEPSRPSSEASSGKRVAWSEADSSVLELTLQGVRECPTKMELKQLLESTPDVAETLAREGFDRCYEKCKNLKRKKRARK